MLPILAVVALLSASACASASARKDAPAVITSPTPQARAELARVVSDALRGAPVTLADDALIRDSALIVERARARGPHGAPLNGRDTGRPEHFRLVKDGAGCVLVHEETGERFPLTSVTCVAK